MRNLTLHGLLEAFTSDAGSRLDLAASEGEEVPFEVVTSDGRRSGSNPLYCYRPLTADFIRARLGLLVALPSYAPAARALEGIGGLEPYLRARGEKHLPGQRRELADLALRDFLARVYDERSDFVFDATRFEIAYQELEHALYQGRCVTEVIAPLLGIDLDPDTDELALGEGLSIVRLSALGGAPEELLGSEQAPLALVLRIAHDRKQHPSVSFARTRFRRVLTALRLFDRGRFAIGLIGYSRIDDGVWSPVSLGSSGRPRMQTLIERDSEDELRGFCSLIGRRIGGQAPGPGRRPDNSGAGEVMWALARFEMGCERIVPFEALTDYLLGLRALLEPEGPASGRLAQRLALICAPPEGRAALAERTAHAIALERAVIAGVAPSEPGVDAVVDELAEHLRAILRDVLCGHLSADVRAVADELLAASVPPEPEEAVPIVPEPADDAPEETPAGETPAGETPAGETPAGETQTFTPVADEAGETQPFTPFAPEVPPLYFEDDDRSPIAAQDAREPGATGAVYRAPWHLRR
ncbi:MAG: hypothetical protein FWD04_05770 [Conexibacteraceae bacterium]|nr:hypothetical protein [Conexibacteraceae bacterium]